MSFKFTLNEEYLNPGEQALFSEYLKSQGVDESVWQIYPSFFKVKSRWTRPMVLRVFKEGSLIAAAFLIECRHTGRALFKSPFLYKPVNWSRVPVYVWLRAGFGPEVIANPGFYASDVDPDQIADKIIQYLNRKLLAFFITDYRSNESLNKGAKVFPYVDEGSVNVSGMETVQDYISEHGNLKKKMRYFKNKGGTIEVLNGSPDEHYREAMINCADATMRKSFVYSPFQDIFMDVIRETLLCNSSSFVHIVSKMNEEVIGYHSYVESGPSLRMMHGAFNRDLKSTCHAYENIITETVGYAIERKLTKVFFGPIMNETKRRMMREAEPCASYFYSRNTALRFILSLMYARSQFQNKNLMAFATRKKK